MSHVKIDYTDDNSGRRAIIDLVRWFGLSCSKQIFRAVRDAQTFADLDSIDRAILFGGVTGEPVRRLIEYYHGPLGLAAWSASEDFDQSLIPTKTN